ncbi:hypothetical protein CLV88_1401 [Shimia abyssi]|uniref:Uncharacterized protein n=1 Tax=Shimia abyssi TaxID=1662395 RepID=A0A2P8ESP7_9RHOB|nr:hypothetical protein CLV88_1401 [Shimia abyssi]
MCFGEKNFIPPLGLFQCNADIVGTLQKCVAEKLGNITQTPKI